MKEVGGVFHISSFYLTLRAMLHLFSSASSVATERLCTKLLFFFKENVAKRKAGTCWVGLGWVWRVGEGGV